MRIQLMTISINSVFFRWFVAFTLLLFLSCVSKNNPEQTKYSSLSLADLGVQDSVFKSEIAQKERMLQEEPVQQFSNRSRAMLLLQLAILYSHRNNPNPDLIKAEKYLKQYALLKDQVSVEYTQALLNGMIDDQRKYAHLSREKKQLEKLNSGLVFKIRSKNKIIQGQEKIIQENKKEINKKNEIIEKLKVLDIQFENRRAETE